MAPPTDYSAIENRLGKLERRTSRLTALLAASLLLSLVLASALFVSGSRRAEAQDRTNEGLRDRLDRLERDQPAPPGPAALFRIVGTRES
jgi:hypothetical protein